MGWHIRFAVGIKNIGMISWCVREPLISSTLIVRVAKHLNKASSRSATHPSEK